MYCFYLISCCIRFNCQLLISRHYKKKCLVTWLHAVRTRGRGVAPAWMRICVADVRVTRLAKQRIIRYCPYKNTWYATLWHNALCTLGTYKRSHWIRLVYFTVNIFFFALLVQLSVFISYLGVQKLNQSLLLCAAFGWCLHYRRFWLEHTYAERSRATMRMFIIYYTCSKPIVFFNRWTLPLHSWSS